MTTTRVRLKCNQSHIKPWLSELSDRRTSMTARAPRSEILHYFQSSQIREPPWLPELPDRSAFTTAEPQIENLHDFQSSQIGVPSWLPSPTSENLHDFQSSQIGKLRWLPEVVVAVVVVVVGQTVGSISSRTLAYDCLCTLELCTASMIATS